MQPQEDDYLLIPIQQLEERRQVYPKKVSRKELIQSIDRSNKMNDHPVLFYQDSGLSQERIIQGNRLFYENHFFNAFSYAYSQHGDILLVPDQVWIMIIFYMSRYIDENANKLRKKLVKHEQVKSIQIQEYFGTKEESLLAQKNWDYFFQQIIKAVEKETINGVVQNFACDFSTTNPTYKVISTSIIMHSMKKFFKYSRKLGKACGINNVYMAGTREDWGKMIPKLENMIQYDVDGKLKQFIQHMKIILQKFLETFEGCPDLEWWNTIMTTPERRKIYLGQILEVQGWIMDFFGIFEKTELHGFPQMNIQVPITMTNSFTSKQKQLLLVSDWVSVSKIGDRIYKPDLGVAIFEISQKPIQN